MEKSLSSSLSASIVRLRLTVLRVGFKFKLAMSRVRTPAPSRLLMALLAGAGVHVAMATTLPQNGHVVSGGVTIGTLSNDALTVTMTRLPWRPVTWRALKFAPSRTRCTL